MKSAIFSALALLAGCGNFHSGYSYQNQQPGLTAFVIDSNVGVVADPDTYGITTDGNIWKLTWLGDAFSHSFQGTISCDGCQFGYARFENALPGDSVTNLGDQLTFDAVTDNSTPQTLELQASTQPLVYDLYIDGQPAIGSVVFRSQRTRATTDVMPFGLYSDNAAFKAGTKTSLAPEFISQLPKDGGAQTFMVTPPAPASSAASSSAVKQ